MNLKQLADFFASLDAGAPATLVVCPDRGRRTMTKPCMFVLMAAALIVSACGASSATVVPPQPSYWPTTGWQTSTPEAQGFDSAKLAQGLQAMADAISAVP